MNHLIQAEMAAAFGVLALTVNARRIAAKAKALHLNHRAKRIAELAYALKIAGMLGRSDRLVAEKARAMDAYMEYITLNRANVEQAQSDAAWEKWRNAMAAAGYEAC
jgi:hypothetical protein